MSKNDDIVTFDGGPALVSEQCVMCTHYDPESIALSTGACKAFKLIPLEIWNNRFDHSKAYPGDGGVRYQARRRAAA